MYCGKIKYKRMLFYHQNVSESIKTLRTRQMKSMPSGIDIILKYLSFTFKFNVGHISRVV